jgi:hypothetical protein
MEQSADQRLNLDHQCPQCGAPISIDESARLVSCPFCRVRHFIHMQGPARYFIAPRTAVPASCTYVPYWRMRGMEFALRGNELKSSLVDANMVALTSPLAPPNLGYQTQAARLKFAQPSSAGTFLKPTYDQGEFMRRLAKRRAAMEDWSPQPDEPVTGMAQHIKLLADTLTSDTHAPRRGGAAADLSRFLDQVGARPLASVSAAVSDNFRAYIGETVSLVYAPVYPRDNRWIDGISDQVWRSAPTASEILGEQEPQTGFPLSFLPTLCPQCGWDMDGAPDSLVLTCNHCASVWQPRPPSWERMSFMLWPTSPSPTDLWAPFWCFGIESSGVRLQTMADLIRLASIPKAILPAMEQAPLSFWLPAFKMEAERFLLLAKLMTAAQTRPTAGDTVPSGSIYPASVSLAEAAEAIPMLLLSMTGMKKNVYRLIADASFSVRSSALVYVPFVRRNYEYIQPDINAAIHVNTLRWARAAGEAGTSV